MNRNKKEELLSFVRRIIYSTVELIACRKRREYLVLVVVINVCVNQRIKDNKIIRVEEMKISMGIKDSKSVHGLRIMIE